ncbi:hypothetical protein [Flavimarina sp. Hel_I_48]|uniref:hypothetical protein n=1 Tax=Flavimarina sp. Hel_I_48 TaxID=1392488 RepID=UPI0004DF0CCC|nr:hypothetical protein [Flavimarina sp. Hel_I_48]
MTLFLQFLVDSNFFGDYHTYITNEIDYFRTNYQKKKAIYSQWKLLRSPHYFSWDSGAEDKKHKDFYIQWVADLNGANIQNNFWKENQPTLSDTKENVNIKLHDLAENILPFITENQRANKVGIMVNDMLAAHEDIRQMKIKIRKTLINDIQKFKRVLNNLNQLLE